MTDEFYHRLKEFGRVKTNELLAKHVTIKIGGPARFFVSVNKIEQLVKLLHFLKNEEINYLILGGGSNLLISDEGFDGLIIHISSSEPPKVIPAEDRFNLEIDAGVYLSAVVNFAAQNSLQGLAWGIGIPGTMGGAVRGNAGAMGMDTSSILQWAEVWRDGEVLKLSAPECGYGYRDSYFKRNQDIILRACIRLQAGDKQAIMAKMQEYLKQRKHSPFPSAGSFFKNIKLDKWPGDKKELPELFLQRGTVPVGWLADQLGLRGLASGGAKISDEHGNYIINFNNATQADVLALVEEIKQKVYNKFGVELEPEVQIIK